MCVLHLLHHIGSSYSKSIGQPAWKGTGGYMFVFMITQYSHISMFVRAAQFKRIHLSSSTLLILISVVGELKLISADVW